MSTVFAIHKRGQMIPLVDDMPLIDEYDSDDMVNVAFRGNGSGIWFTNDIAHLLPTETKVYATNNTQQGVYTIGDILKEMKQ